MQQSIESAAVFQSEVGGEHAKQALLRSLEHDPNEPFQVGQRRGNHALCAQEFQSLLDQRNGTVAFHRLGKQFAGEPQILSPSTLTELVRAPDLIQVLIQGVVTLSIEGKSRS